MSFLATVVIMAIWNLVGIFAGLALLLVTFIWRQNKLVFSNVMIIPNDYICTLLGTSKLHLQNSTLFLICHAVVCLLMA